MKCKDCSKELMGGFRVDEGFQCAECAIYEVEVNSIIGALQRIVKHADELDEKRVEGQKYKNLSEELKKGVREIAHLCEFVMVNSSILNKKEKV